MPKLQISLLEHGEVIHELTGECISIGRHADNTIPIDDASVSTHHAEIRLREGAYYLKDLDSTNGTRVNDNPDGEWQLKEGDRILFGNIEAFFSSETEKAPLPAAQEIATLPAAESQPPSGFNNASPFKRKAKQKTPGGALSMTLAAVAILIFIAAMVFLYSL